MPFFALAISGSFAFLASQCMNKLSYTARSDPD